MKTKAKTSADKMSVHRFVDHIYHAEVMFFHMGTPKDVEDHLQKTLKTRRVQVDWDWRYDGGVSAFENAVEKRLLYVVWIRHRRNHHTLLHECFHLACRIFRDRGILLNFGPSGCEEHFAYYMGALYKGLWRLANR